MFNWTDNVTLPKITDVVNTSNMPGGLLRMFTDIWIWCFGGWFFAIIIGVIGASLYVKYDNVMVPVAWFLVSIGLLGGAGGIFAVDTNLPSAVMFVYIIGIFAAIALGVMFYKMFVSKNE